MFVSSGGSHYRPRFAGDIGSGLRRDGIRQVLGRRHFSILTLPLAAGFIGAVFGALAIRWNWTQTPELALIVPSLMLVPGPHRTETVVTVTAYGAP